MADTVHKTYDYEKFKLIESNRTVNRGHIENIKKGFEEYGNLTRVQPILVNDRFEIIDGQHRFLACRDIGQPIYYSQIPGLGIAEARSMNILHKQWRMQDYAESYAKEGNKEYIKFLELIEDYGFSYSATVAYALGSQAKGIFKDFRNGDFLLTNERAARDRLSKLSDIGMYVPFAGAKSFSMAVLKMIGVEGYDHGRMLKKLELNQNLLEERANIPDYLRLLENIYNHGTSERNRLRFY